MSYSSLAAVQVGIYTALTGDATLAALLVNGSGVRDHVPPANPKYPLVVIGDTLEVPERTFGQGGHEVLADVTVYTRDGSTDVRGSGTSGYKQALAIHERIVFLLVGTVTGARTFAATGFDVVDVDVDFAQSSRDTDGITRQLDARYRMRLETQ